MKRIILLIMLMAMSSPAFALRAAIVVENTGAVGVDTMLYNALVNDLGYTCWYFDVDNIGSSPATYNSAYFDTAADVWISVGIEAALPSASSQCDSIANAATGYMAIGRDMWDEINLGTATAASTQSPKFKNLGLDHWITKVLADTVRMYGNTTGANQYSIAIPDSVSSTDIRPLLISIYYAGDTAQAMLVAADSGARIFGTSGGPAGSHIAKGRRVFCGFFQNTSERPDSCQLWTIMLRSVAWLAKDTIGTILNRACFSGIEEIEWCSVVENSSGTDSIESYGTYDSNIGQDHDEKHAFVKIRNKAMQRKFGSVYRAVDFSRVWMRLIYKGTGWDRAVPSAWSNSFTFQPIIRKWQVERKNCIASAISCPNACWTYAWIDTAATPDVYYAWGTGGARSYGTDTWDLKYDTLTITETTAIANTKFTIDMQPDSLGVRALDTLRNFGWASRMIASSSTPDDPDYGEMTFYGPANTNAITSIGIASPIINVTLSSFSTTVPTPTIAIATPEYDDDSVVFVGTYGQTFSPQEVVLSNSQGGALECATISDNSGGWLYLVASGTNMPITTTIYMVGQQVGYRSATVTITCADASNSPRTFKVVSNLTSASGRRATGKEIWR